MMKNIFWSDKIDGTEIIITDDYDNLFNIKFKYNCTDYVNNVQNIMAYDTETTNGILDGAKAIPFNHDLFLEDDDYRNLVKNSRKVSCVYLWQFAIEDGNKIWCFYGRTMTAYLDFILKLTGEIARQMTNWYDPQLDPTRRAEQTQFAIKHAKYSHIQPYVHNFAFDFQLLRNIHDEDFGKHTRDRGATFARSERRPMKAIAIENRVKIEYRDSYVLTQKSLKNWSKDSKLSIQKLDVDDNFYLRMRNPLTALDKHTILYGCFDVATMIEGLKSYRTKYKALENIPLTQTGAVRRDCIENIARKNPEWSQRCYNITKGYTFDFFLKLVSLFQGGWTHANSKLAGVVLKNIKCFDFASSYPAVMVTRKMPVGPFEEIDVSQFEEVSKTDINTGNIRWFAEIKFKGVQSKLQNTYWSSSKVLFDSLDDALTDNGRIYAAGEMIVALTDLDYDTFKKAYYIEDYEVLSLYVAEADYLPREMIEIILKYYGYKTSLKNIAGSESLYGESKQWINSIYGCAVTRIVTDLIEYFSDIGWQKTDCDEFIFMDTINKLKPEETFLTYAIGIWITSWARHNLWDFITARDGEFDAHTAYCDTDSIKGCFDDDDMNFVAEYNNGIEQLENEVARTIGIDPALYAPKTKKGETKRIGLMTQESDCQEFATLGAKRYCDLVDGEIECTIAGLPKKSGSKKLKSVSDFLRSDLVWNTKESGKSTVYYEDNQPTVEWADEQGHVWIETDRYGVCVLPTSFDLSVSPNYVKFAAFCRGILEPDELFNDVPLVMFKRTYQL